MKILFFGDSITDMNRDRTETAKKIYTYGHGFVFYVAGDLARINPEKYQVINRGVGGNKVTDLIVRLEEDVIAHKPDVVNVLIGVNDVWHGITYGTGTCITEFEKTYREILDTIKKKLPNTKIIMCEPFYLHGIATDEDFQKFEKVKDFALIVRKIAKEYDIPFLSLQNKLEEKAEKHDASYYLFDGVHPNVAGARLIADEWIKLFFKEIEKDVKQ